MIVVFLGPRLLPHRNPPEMPADLTLLEATLRRQYRIDGEFADGLYGRRYGVDGVVIPPRSRLIGERFERGMVTESGELTVVAAMRNEVPTR